MRVRDSQKVTIFHECEPEFLHDLVLKMRAYIFTPGDLICRKGEVAREMFIIADGLLEVIRYMYAVHGPSLCPIRKWIGRTLSHCEPLIVTSINTCQLLQHVSHYALFVLTSHRFQLIYTQTSFVCCVTVLK